MLSIMVSSLVVLVGLRGRRRPKLPIVPRFCCCVTAELEYLSAWALVGGWSDAAPPDQPSEPCLPGASSGHDRSVAVLGGAARRAVDRAGHGRIVGLRIFDR
jgi:hypothetical protein